MPVALVPAAYVRARWAYSELLSGRPYRGKGVQELKRKALGHVPFDDLRGEERDQLEQAWYRVRGVPTFINAFAGIAAFELVHWSKETTGGRPCHQVLCAGSWQPFGAHVFQTMD